MRFTAFPRLSTVLPLALLILLVFVAPLRQAAIVVLRAPYQFSAGLVRTAALIPQLPQLAREQHEQRQTLTELQLENSQLREQLRAFVHAEALKALPGLPKSGVVAQVIGRSMLPAEQTIMLNRGRRQGLVTDQVILDIHGVMGRVAEVSDTTAIVMLLTDADSRVGAAVERSREAGVLRGHGRTLVELIYLDLDADIEVGDRVVTAGLGEVFPKGLMLGIVSQVVRDEVTGTASAWVRPAARLGRIEEVLCLPPVK